MHKLRSRLAAIAAILLATLVAATAWADTGPDSYAGDTTPAREPNGGTAAEDPPAVLPSGGVPGPAMRGGAKTAQRPPGFQEEPPQVEPPPEDGNGPAPPPEETPEAPGEVPDEGAGQAPAGTAAPTGVTGVDLPSTGLEIAALAAIGAGLLLAGLALRRRPA
jgi:LPXTG-motif cell wall-anchored protein